MKWWLRAILFLVLLIPSFSFAWQHREMKQLGWMRDDTVYLATAKSLLSGAGYRIEALPSEPWQTKYPPGFPLVIASALTIAGPPALWVAAWIGVPLLIAFSWRLFLQWEFSESMALLLTALLAVNGYIAFFGMMLMSETLFAAALAAALVLYNHAEKRDRAWTWLACGVLVGLAFFVRTAALPLMVVLPVLGWIRTRSRRVIYFAVGAGPLILGWFIWAATHRNPERDLLTIYHTDYLGIFLWNASPGSYHLMLWKNLEGLLRGFGTLMLPGQQDDLLLNFARQCLGVFGIVGAVRFCRQQRRAVAFGIAAASQAILLLVWCYPASERLVLPLFPLFLAGFAWELRRLTEMIKLVWMKQRGPAIAAAVFLVSALSLGAAQQVKTWRETLPEMVTLQRAVWADNEACFEHVRQHLPPSERIVTIDESLLWMATGHKAVSVQIPVAWWYADREDWTAHTYSTPEREARQYGANYVLMNMRSISVPKQFEPVTRESLGTNPNLELMLSCGEARLWRVRQ